ncbi:MAG: hypothetical protein ACR2LR_05965 [Hassallia sp.]
MFRFTAGIYTPFGWLMQSHDRATRLPYCFFWFFCFADSDSTTQSSKTF